MHILLRGANYMAKTQSWWLFTGKRLLIALLALVCIVCIQPTIQNHFKPLIEPISVSDMSENTSEYNPLNSDANITPGMNNKNGQISPVATQSSLLNDTSSLFFYYETTSYCYGITKDGMEVFAHLDPDGTKTDAVHGGGTLTIWDTTDTPICNASYVANFEVLSESPSKSVRVTYANSLAGSATSNTYTFYENYVKVSTALYNYTSSTPVGVAFLERHYPNNYVDVEQKMNTNWIFPENGDFPYKDFDSYATIHNIDSVHKLYTFFHGDDANIKQLYEYYNKDHFILKTENNTLTHNEVNYELVFENVNTNPATDYTALFKAKGQPLTLGIAPTENTSLNTTVFKDMNTVLNLNISNITTKSADATLSFHLYDYYGNDLLKETRSLSIPASLAYNRLFRLKEITEGKSGIYYFDVTLSGSDYTYRELYPFILLSDYTYKHKDSNPFGVSGVRFGTHEANDATVYLADALGMSHMRVGISTPEYIGTDYSLLTTYLQKLKDKDVKISGQFVTMDNWQLASDAESFKNAFFYSAYSTAPYLSAIEIGNELNMIDYTGFSSREDAMNYYVNTMFSPALDVLNGTGIPIISAGVGLSDAKWMELLSQYKVINSSDILSTHAYAYPHSPDFTDDPTIEHSFESALVRVRNYLDKTGDKTWYLSEMGLPTTPLMTADTFSGSDLRTQADYTIREYLLALSYGADVVQSYSLYDQVNTFKGFDNTNSEYHFGMFYDQDYYGRVMPKPYAAAYATMTKELDGVQNVTENDTSSNTLRTFSVTLADGSKLTAAYSTIYRLSNDAITGVRTPNLPWNNQWLKSETAVFKKAANAKQVYTIDLMGNKTTYRADRNGKVSIKITGAPVFIHGVK